MTAQDVQIKILEPMQRVYIPPRRMEPEDETAALRDYVDTLQQFGGDDLSQAWGRVRETHIRREWPVPAAFYKFANESRRDKNENGKTKNRHAVEQVERWDTWKTVSKSAMAQEAIRRGVAWPLKCTVLYEGKRAEQIDLRALTAGKASAERTYASIRDGRRIEFKGRLLTEFRGPDRDLALSMYGHIQANETRTVEEINYGVPDAPV